MAGGRSLSCKRLDAEFEQSVNTLEEQEETSNEAEIELSMMKMNELRKQLSENSFRNSSTPAIAGKQRKHTESTSRQWTNVEEREDWRVSWAE